MEHYQTRYSTDPNLLFGRTEVWTDEYIEHNPDCFSWEWPGRTFNLWVAQPKSAWTGIWFDQLAETAQTTWAGSEEGNRMDRTTLSEVYGGSFYINPTPHWYTTALPYPLTGEVDTRQAGAQIAFGTFFMHASGAWNEVLPFDQVPIQCFGSILLGNLWLKTAWHSSAGRVSTGPYLYGPSFDDASGRPIGPSRAYNMHTLQRTCAASFKNIMHDCANAGSSSNAVIPSILNLRRELPPVELVFGVLA